MFGIWKYREKLISIYEINNVVYVSGSFYENALLMKPKTDFKFELRTVAGNIIYKVDSSAIYDSNSLSFSSNPRAMSLKVTTAEGEAEGLFKRFIDVSEEVNFNISIQFYNLEFSKDNEIFYMKKTF